ncbi:NAD(P)H:quinone oxidoreductase [Flavimarina sp. Hel_I_48]|uniref:NAD(P)H:quinone oxidoreductase n=1 Tax=Flavimarina sp. Hel_I_48 TaxID=1392488 RepID=UPI0004DF1121|nr:NAD(P)H:quinone oxidoreductase [Flavimarina sp. Hel_I_48]
MGIKVAVIYYSATGTNYEMAKQARDAVKSENVDEVKLLKFKETAPQEAINSKEDWKKHVENTKDIPEVTLDDLEAADAIIFSIPTRYGNMPSQVQSFFDTTGGLWSDGKLVNKVVSGMTSAQNPHGGQETTLMSLYKTMIHWGAIIAPPSYTDPVIFKSGGNPYGTSTEGGDVSDAVKASIKHQAQRTVQIGRWIKAGMN